MQHMPDLPFSEEQKQYLQGFMAGVLQRGGLSFVGQTADGRLTHEPEQAVRDLATPAPTETLYGTPIDRLCKQERIKLELHPLRHVGSGAGKRGGRPFPGGG